MEGCVLSEPSQSNYIFWWSKHKMLISLESERLSRWAQPPEVQFSGASLRLAMKEFCMQRLRHHKTLNCLQLALSGEQLAAVLLES